MVLNRLKKSISNVNSDSSEMIVNISVGILIKVISVLSGLLLNVILARTVGVQETGLYYLSMTIIIIASVISTFGLRNTITRYVASKMVDNDWGAIKVIFNKSLSITSVIAIIITLYIFINASTIANGLFNKAESEIAITWMSMAILPFSISLIIASAIKGMHLVRIALIIESVLIPVGTTIGILCLYSFYEEIGLYLSYVIATTLTAIFAYFFWQLRMPKICNIHNKFPTKIILESCVPMFLSNLSGMVIQWFPILFLGILATTDEVGLYAIAYRTAMLVGFLLLAINSFIAPKISVLYNKGEIKKIHSLAILSTRIMIFLTTPIFLLILIYPDSIMSIFGNDFKGGTSALLLLAIGQFVVILVGPVGMLLAMTGNESIIKKSSLISALICILICIFFIPDYGIIGAAFAGMISVSFSSFMNLYYVNKKLNIFTWSISN